MPWVTGCHHIFGIKHLLGQLRHSESTVLLAATRRQRCKASHKEVKTGEGHQVDSNLPQVSIQLAYWLKGGGLRINYCDARPFCATHFKLVFLF